LRRSSAKVGTRGGILAQANAEFAVSQLREALPRVNFRIVVLRTAGDRIRTAIQMRGAGEDVFTREIERALLKRKIDCAVHDLKEMPARLPEGVELGAILQREEAADAFVGRGETPLRDLPSRSIIGAAGTRRKALLKAAFPLFEIEDLRGSLDDCLEKLRNPRSRLAGIVVSACALRRLSGDTPHQLVPKNFLAPAAGQGALAVEIRAGDEDLRKLLAPVHHPQTAAAVETERAFLRLIGADRRIPVGVHAEVTEDGLLHVFAAMAMPDGSRLVRGEMTGSVEDPESLAAGLDTLMRSRDAGRIIGAVLPSARKKAKASSNGRRTHPRAKTRSRR
jgi:hydroxymethylbilane synthase